MNREEERVRNQTTQSSKTLFERIIELEDQGYGREEMITLLNQEGFKSRSGLPIKNSIINNEKSRQNRKSRLHKNPADFGFGRSMVTLPVPSLPSDPKVQVAVNLLEVVVKMLKEIGE